MDRAKRSVQIIAHAHTTTIQYHTYIIDKSKFRVQILSSQYTTTGSDVMEDIRIPCSRGVSPPACHYINMIVVCPKWEVSGNRLDLKTQDAISLAVEL